jgi:hypothetical protein
MADELKDQRIPIMMAPSEVKAIDDWMFANRIKSRSEAIRRLTNLGINHEPAQVVIDTASDLITRLVERTEITDEFQKYFDALRAYSHANKAYTDSLRIELARRVRDEGVDALKNFPNLTPDDIEKIQKILGA